MVNALNMTAVEYEAATMTGCRMLASLTYGRHDVCEYCIKNRNA